MRPVPIVPLCLIIGTLVGGGCSRTAGRPFVGHFAFANVGQQDCHDQHYFRSRRGSAGSQYGTYLCGFLCR